MKTVSGKIVSTKPVTLSKAANILSNFVTSDNGASQSVSAYLRRASAAFNELVYFKKHHKPKKHRPKEEASIKSDTNPINSEEDDVRVLENGLGNRKFDLDPVEVNEGGAGKAEGKRKREKRKEKIDGRLGSEKNDEIDDKFEDNSVTVKDKNEEKKKKKKKRKNAEVDGGEFANSVESERRKKKRRTDTDD